MKRKIKIITKVVVLAIIAMVYNVMIQTVSSVITNELAMQQMQNYDTSSMGIQAYTYITNHAWIVFVLTAILLFHKDISHIVTKIKENIKNEEK